MRLDHQADGRSSLKVYDLRNNQRQTSAVVSNASLPARTTMASVAPSTQSERLNQIFNGLKNKNVETRAQSAKELYHFVSIPSYILILFFILFATRGLGVVIHRGNVIRRCGQALG